MHTQPNVPLTVDVGRQIDEGDWGRYQRWLIALTALTIVFDGIDNQLLGVAIPAIMQEWGAPRAAFAPIVSIGYAGLMVGGALAGVAGDRVGRRTIDASRPVLPILVMLTITGGLINAVQTTMYALAAHVYPGIVRATGVGAAASVGRVGAILSGYAGAAAIDFGGSASYFWVIAAAMAATFVALATVRRHVPRRRHDVSGAGQDAAVGQP